MHNSGVTVTGIRGATGFLDVHLFHFVLSRGSLLKTIEFGGLRIFVTYFGHKILKVFCIRAYI